MECYATPWQLWREHRNLLFFIEPSFALGAPLFFTISSIFYFNCVHARCKVKGLQKSLNLGFDKIKNLKK